ncbi:hypothetical protein F0562_021897 [Nyssa sinensis]|uniref:Uncharacterized protein n=1 Tax=Nyssa sinensis TaxID=561372 RepID=A0A5J5BMP0_9ASTE|nr:hypothetical protein F0562_021897 [Nyssa sinensis]
MEKTKPGPITEVNAQDRPSFKLLLSCPSGLSSSQVSVVFDELYDRIPRTDINLENSISETWDRGFYKAHHCSMGTSSGIDAYYYLSKIAAIQLC